MQLVSPPFPSPSAPLGHLTFVSPRNSEGREGRERDRGKGGREKGKKRGRRKVTLSERGKKEKMWREVVREKDEERRRGREHTTKRKGYTAVP